MIRSHGYVAQWAARKRRLAVEREAWDDVCAARRNGRREGIEEERERHTFECGVGDGHKLIGQQPQHEFIRIALGPVRSALHEFDPRYVTRDARIITFRSVRKAWASGHGHTVVWFDWERVG